MPPQPRSKRTTPAHAASTHPTPVAPTSPHRLDEDHPSLRYPDTHPSFHEHLIHSMSDEAKALLFTIYVLGCLLLALSLTSIFLTPERLPASQTPVTQEQKALLQQPTTRVILRGTPIEVPAL